MAPLSSSFTRRRCCVLVSFGGRPGENRTFNAWAPPLRRRLRQRMTELAAHPISRATAFRLRPASSSVNARWRRFSSRSAEPLGLGMGVPSRYTHYCIIYAGRNNERVRFGRVTAHPSLGVSKREALAGLIQLRKELKHVPNLNVANWQALSKARLNKLL